MSIIKAKDLVDSFEEKGFHYTKDLLFNYYISLITKPFVILTGISGSGKSKIAELFAEIINDTTLKSYELIPVKPNWRDNKGLFGYHNLIDNSYYITPMIRLFLRALHKPNTPFFLILDEMNIAKTEHYFADYLSLIESRRIEKFTDDISTDELDLEEIFTYSDDTSLSEAIVLSALDINKLDQMLEIKDYRENRFSKLWQKTIFGGKNWTAQYRSELNQGTNRLANRVFEGGNGTYRLKKKDDINPADWERIENLKKLYTKTMLKEKVRIVQDNIILHNSDTCLSADGNRSDCRDCAYKNSEKYKCEKLYNERTEQYLVPPELPIPINVFTVGTVNVDETTYMFSPKVLDRSNVIEFNEVDFSGIYNLSENNIDMINTVVNTVVDEEYYFDDDADMPKLVITMAGKEKVNKFIEFAPNQFDDLIKIFTILKRYNLHFGYRVMNEISLYMYNVENNTSYVNRMNRGMDNQILQKILPKLYGSYDNIWNPLTEILGVLLIDSKEIVAENADVLLDKLKEYSNGKINKLALDGTIAEDLFKYPKSAIKIVNMLNDLNSTGFAAFIK